jgi:hypothetical protein
LSKDSIDFIDDLLAMPAKNYTKISEGEA